MIVFRRNEENIEKFISLFQFLLFSKAVPPNQILSTGVTLPSINAINSAIL